MATYNKCKFEGTTVVLDGNEYTECEFHNSKIVLTRGNFSLRKCTFNRCEFEFGGEAANIKNIVEGLLSQPRPEMKAPESRLIAEKEELIDLEAPIITETKT